jgi:acetylornithine deacetylase
LGIGFQKDQPVEPLGIVPTEIRARDTPAAKAAAERLVQAATAVGVTARSLAARYGTNACVYAAAGLPCVVFGPGSIAQAHTADEWIDLAEVERAVDVLEQIIRVG